MTPLRALIASIFAAVLLGAGMFIAANFADGRPHDLVPILSLERTPFSIWCFLAAWGAILAGLLGVLSAFLAFISPEEDDDPRLRRRSFPKSAPIVLIAIALALAYFALRCGSASVATPIAVPVEPMPSPSAEASLLGGEPVAETSAAASNLAPLPVSEASSFQWRYMDPLIRDEGALWSGGPEPFSDEDENERLLCGKAWVAVSGSASQEGPMERNAERARLRTVHAVLRAARWLERHQECGPTIVLGIDLGQHAPIASEDDEGRNSAYQRQVLVVSRTRASADESLSADAAEAEFRVFLSDPAGRAALYAGRVFPSEPQVISP